jgi:hypothetical protein
MIRTLAFGLAAVVLCHGLAHAQGAGQSDGNYVLTQPRHKAKVNKVEALTVKQKSVRKDKKPVTTDRCLQPGGTTPQRC